MVEQEVASLAHDRQVARTTIISLNQGRMLSRHAGRVRLLSRTIMQSEILGRGKSSRMRSPTPEVRFNS
jgi:hypothetical protein